MAMISLKQPKKSKKDLKAESYPSTIGGDRDLYPYGTRLCFEEPEVEKMKLDTLPDAETLVKGTFEGYVSRASSNKSTDGTRRSVEIQITDVDVKFTGNVEARETKRMADLTSTD